MAARTPNPYRDDVRSYARAEAKKREQRRGIDDNQPGLFSQQDRETQKRAAFAATPRTGTTRRAVYDAIASAGARGMTDHEIAEATGLTYSSLGPRRRELISGGWVRDSGKTRTIHLRNVSEQTVWIVARAL